MFAGDIELYSSFFDMSCNLQTVCDKLVTWTEKWQLQIAFDKCSIHRISNRDNVGSCDSVYRIGDRILRWSTETRDLGVIIHNKLNFNSHISDIAHKAHVRASLILRTFVTRDPMVLTKAFITYGMFIQFWNIVRQYGHPIRHAV